MRIRSRKQDLEQYSAMYSFVKYKSRSLQRNQLTMQLVIN